MAPNLRSVVAQVYQVGFRQAASRRFSSSRNGERLFVESSDPSVVPYKRPSFPAWFLTGYGVYYFWEFIRIRKAEYELVTGRKERRQELLSKMKRYKEQRERASKTV